MRNAETFRNGCSATVWPLTKDSLPGRGAIGTACTPRLAGRVFAEDDTALKREISQHIG
jgi:hypothetical protein